MKNMISGLFSPGNGFVRVRRNFPVVGKKMITVYAKNAITPSLISFEYSNINGRLIKVEKEPGRCNVYLPGINGTREIISFSKDEDARELVEAISKKVSPGYFKYFLIAAFAFGIFSSFNLTDSSGSGVAPTAYTSLGSVSGNIQPQIPSRVVGPKPATPSQMTPSAAPASTQSPQEGTVAELPVSPEIDMNDPFGLKLQK